MEIITYEYYKQLIKEKLNFTEQEEIGIIQFMYKDGWSVNDTINHIRSIRDFNGTRKI